MAFSPDKFRQHFATHGDFAKPSKFKVRILRSRFPDVTTAEGLSFQCEAAELPGLTVNTSEAKVYGASWHVATTPVFSDLNLTFVCASDMWEKKYFDDWLQLIVPTGYATVDTLASHPRYQQEYISTIVVDQYADYEKENAYQIPYRVTIIDAFPTSISPLPLNWAEDGLHRLTVTFKYRKWARGTKQVEVEQKTIASANNSLDGTK